MSQVNNNYLFKRYYTTFYSDFKIDATPNNSVWMAIYYKCPVCYKEHAVTLEFAPVSINTTSITKICNQCNEKRIRLHRFG